MALGAADPGSHVLHVADASSLLSWYLPSLQARQAVDLVLNFLPMEQNLQPYVVDLSNSWNLPGAHSVQGEREPDADSPRPHD